MTMRLEVECDSAGRWTIIDQDEQSVVAELGFSEADYQLAVEIVRRRDKAEP